METEGAAKYKPGDLVYALPGHICPTVALHKDALIAEGGEDQKMAGGVWLQGTGY